MKTITLKSGKERTLQRRHPWIFSGAIQKMDREIAEGDLVTVVNPQDRFLALGQFQVGSIAVRVLSFEPCDVDGRFWRERLARARRWDWWTIPKPRPSAWSMPRGMICPG